MKEQLYDGTEQLQKVGGGECSGKVPPPPPSQHNPSYIRIARTRDRKEGLL